MVVICRILTGLWPGKILTAVSNLTQNQRDLTVEGKTYFEFNGNLCNISLDNYFSMI